MADRARITKDGQPTRHRVATPGPFRHADGGLSDAGREFLAAWLGEWPAPARLLATAHRRMFKAARASGWGLDDLDSLCAEAAVKALLSFDPGLAVRFSTYAARAMRFAVQEQLRTGGRPRALGITVSTASQMGDDDDDGWLASLAVARECRDADRGEMRRAVAAALAGMASSPRHREVLSLRYGLSGEPLTLAEVGARLGVSKERARQIEEAALERARPLLARLYRDHGRASVEEA